LSFTSCAQKKILFDSSSEIQDQIVENNNLIKIFIFYQNEFVKKNGIEFDSIILKNQIEKRIPNEKQFGFATLDWEGEGLKILGSKKASEKEINLVKKEFKKAILFAQKKRPNIKWSYYGLPTRIYWHINEDWEDANMRLLDLFKLQDFISPSLYVLYSETESLKSDNLNYIDKNISFALKIGHLTDKPVLPFIFHRSRRPKENIRESLVNLELWDFYLENIYKNKGVNGVIWWHSENYHYLNRNKIPVI